MKYLILLSTTFFLFVSCANVPKQNAYPLYYQDKMQASEHWQRLAGQVSRAVAGIVLPDNVDGQPVTRASITTKAPPPSTPALGHANPTNPETDALFISDTDMSPFGRAMRTFLIDELTSQGVPLTENPKSMYRLNWQVQNVYHAKGRGNIWPGLPALIFLDIPHFILLGENNSYLKVPHSEVIISFELQTGTSRHPITTDIFYVNDADRSHYWEIFGTQQSAGTLTPVNYIVTNK